MDIITGILLLLGLVLLLLGLFKAAKNAQMVAIVGIIMFIIGGASYIGAVDLGNVGAGVNKGFTGSYQPQYNAAPAPVASSCSANAVTSNGKSQADVLIRNVENASLGYLPGTVSANQGGSFIDSVSANAGASASYASMSNIPNCGMGDLVATVTTGVGGVSSRRLRDVEKNQIVAGYNFNDKAVHKYEILAASEDVANILARSSTLSSASNGQANGSIEITNVVSGTGTADGTAFFQNTSLAAKGTINFYLDIQLNGSSSVFGQYDEPDGAMLSFDTGTAARYSVNSLTLSVDQPNGFSLTKLPNCPPSIVNNRNVEGCWSMPTLKAGVLYRIRGILTADLGDPLPSDTQPIIYLDDKVSFRDTDGGIKYDFFSNSGTNQGVGGTALRFVVS